MISCIFAYAKGAESQSTAVVFADPMSALFLVKNDERARCALSNWLAQGQTHGPPGNQDASARPAYATTRVRWAA